MTDTSIDERHIRVGESPCGWGAARIVIDNADALLSAGEDGADWLRYAVRPRLYPGGEIVLRFNS